MYSPLILLSQYFAIYSLCMYVATTDYIVCTTNIVNGVGLINSVLADTPNFRPTKLWDNQMDDPSSSGPRPTGPAKSASRKTSANPFWF